MAKAKERSLDEVLKAIEDEEEAIKNANRNLSQLREELANKLAGRIDRSALQRLVEANGLVLAEPEPEPTPAKAKRSAGSDKDSTIKWLKKELANGTTKPLAEIRDAYVKSGKGGAFLHHHYKDVIQVTGEGNQKMVSLKD
jgi:transposase